MRADLRLPCVRASLRCARTAASPEGVRSPLSQAADGDAGDADCAPDSVLGQVHAAPDRREVSVTDADACFSESDRVFGSHAPKVTARHNVLFSPPRRHSDSLLPPLRVGAGRPFSGPCELTVEPLFSGWPDAVQNASMVGRVEGYFADVTICYGRNGLARGIAVSVATGKTTPTAHRLQVARQRHSTSAPVPPWPRG